MRVVFLHLPFSALSHAVIVGMQTHILSMHSSSNVFDISVTACEHKNKQTKNHNYIETKSIVQHMEKSSP